MRPIGLLLCLTISAQAIAQALGGESAEVFLDEPRREMDVELHERFVADALEAVDLTGLDDEDVPGRSLEFDAVHVPPSPSGLDELDLVVGMPVRARPGARLSVEEENGDVDVAIVGPDEIVGAALEW